MRSGPRLGPADASTFHVGRLRRIRYRVPAMQTAFPSPEDDDVEDVAWGLTTGGALWRQGERYDAIVWLKRAVEAANEAGAATRADQLNRAATDLIALLAAPPQVVPRGPGPVSRPGSN